MTRPTIIHVARQALQRNLKHGLDEPAIIVRRGRRSQRFHSVEILGPSTMVSSMENPLACGARVWLEVPPTTELRTS